MNNKKSVGLFLCFIMLAFSVAALDIESSKTEYLQGETFIATLQGNILQPIQKQDVGFFRGHVEIPLTFDLLRFDDTYFIYGILPFEENDFAVIIEEVNYQEFNQVKEEDLVFNFTIINQTADFSINPGVVIATDNFDLEFSNNLNSKIVVTYIINEENTSIEVDPQGTEDTTVLIEEFPSTLIDTINIQADTGFGYNIPFYVIKNDSDPKVNITTRRETIDFSLKDIDAELNKDEVYTYTTTLKNLGGEDIEDIVISVSNSLEEFITPSTDFINNLERDEEVEITFRVLFTETGNFSGEIRATTDETTDIIFLDFSIGEDINESSSVVSISDQEQSCADISGNKCSANERCSGEGVFANDGFCCIGECVDKSTPIEPSNGGDSGPNWTAVIIILAILAALLGFLYWKSRRSKKTARDVLNKRSKSFSEKYQTKGKLRNV